MSVGLCRKPYLSGQDTLKNEVVSLKIEDTFFKWCISNSILKSAERQQNIIPTIFLKKYWRFWQDNFDEKCLDKYSKKFGVTFRLVSLGLPYNVKTVYVYFFLKLFKITIIFVRYQQEHLQIWKHVLFPKVNRFNDKISRKLSYLADVTFPFISVLRQGWRTEIKGNVTSAKCDNGDLRQPKNGENEITGKSGMPATIIN